MFLVKIFISYKRIITLFLKQNDELRGFYAGLSIQEDYDIIQAYEEIPRY